jgi:hypothetical protein
MILARCERILRSVIHRGFPELYGSKIALRFGDYDCWMYYEPVGRRSFLLGVDHALEGAPRRVIEGGFAHELAHILRDSRLSRWQLELAFSRYLSSRAWRIHEERNADLEAIRRGYGRELLALMRYARTLGYTFCREQGLLLPEVRRRL